MRAPYEGNTLLNHASYLDAYPTAKAEITSALKFFNNSARDPNVLEIIRVKGLDWFRHPGNEIDMCLKFLDETGDLRFLDRTHVLLTAAHAQLRTDFILKPDGTRASAWANNPTHNQPGFKRWLYLFAELNPTTPDNFYGTDLGPAPTWRWHGTYANAALAMKLNAEKVSPAGYSYSAMSLEMIDYLENHFEPLWRARGVVRPSGVVGAGAINIGSALQRSVLSRARYHRARYLMFGNQLDLDMANLCADWGLQGFETRTHDGKSFVHWATENPPAQTDAGGTPPQPQSFELSRLAAPTINGTVHLNIMNQPGFDAALLTGIANMLRWNVFIDGPTGAPSGDIGGGGVATLGKTKEERQFIKMRGGALVPSRFYLTEYNGVPSGRWSATEALKTSMFSVAKEGGADLKADLLTLRNRFDTLSAGKYFSDKVSLAMAYLADGGWERDGSQITAPGAPRNLVVTAQEVGLAVTWESPASDGGAAIGGYRVSYGTLTNWTVVDLSANARSFAPTGLTPDVLYTVLVSASNQIGVGAEVSGTGTPLAQGSVSAPPDLPTYVTVTAPFLSVNGVRVPIELGSAKRTNNRDKLERALSGAPLTSRFRTKESWSFRTALLDKREARMVQGLFLGLGEGCDYERDLYTEKGVRELSGAVYSSNHSFWNGDLLDVGVHPAYSLSSNSYSAGTFFMNFRIDTDEVPGTPQGCVAQLGYWDSGGSYSPGSEIIVTRDAVTMWVVDGGDVANAVTAQVGAHHLKQGVNSVAATWTYGGELHLCLNGAASFPKRLRYGVSAGGVGIGERYPRNGVDGKEWTDGTTKPFNHKVGGWCLWPFTVTLDDLKIMTGTNTTFRGVYGPPVPPPYLNASGGLIGVGSKRCEGRLVDTTYVSSEHVQLSLELDEL